MAKKKATTVVGDQTAVTETTAKADAGGDTTTTGDPVPTAKAPKGKKSKRTIPSNVTLEQVCEGYLAHMETAGKSPGTIFSYKLEIITALDELGAKTLMSELTAERVLQFMVSDRVTRTKTGVEKAQPTVAKTRRVLRLALTWAEEAKLIEKAPLPEDAAAY
jgi:hypothetical protein